MFGRPKGPRDTTPYPRSNDSRPLAGNEHPGNYVYVVDLDEVIHVAPDGPHMHPKVFGHGRDALYAGESVIGGPGRVDEVNNLSGTFLFKSQRSLCCVAGHLARLGFRVGDVIWYPPDGSAPPSRLTC